MRPEPQSNRYRSNRASIPQMNGSKASSSAGAKPERLDTNRSRVARQEMGRVPDGGALAGQKTDQLQRIQHEFVRGKGTRRQRFGFAFF